MNTNKCGLIIQARAGSTRLPGKMLMPFYDNFTILEIMIKNLLNFFDKDQIILATTNNKIDDTIVAAGTKFNINIFRGDENDVLKRFTDAAEYYDISTIIRVCADNPFLQAKEVKRLYTEYTQLPEPVDYFSFAFPDETPVIKSHLGFFAEITTLAALKK
jgi:spore coat polysaccharide biosynthesis protein SpsF